MSGKPRLLWQLFPSYLLIIVLSLGAATWFASRTFDRFLHERYAADLEARARILESPVSSLLLEGAYARIDRLAKEIGGKAATRVTVILPSGRVVGDTHEDPAAMDNHADRMEISRAVRKGVGVSTRYSRTLDQEMMYVGLALEHDSGLLGVLRTSVPFTPIDRAIGRMTSRVALGGLLVALLAAGLSLWISRRHARPLEAMKQGAERFAAGELDFRLPVPESEEMSALAAALNQMAAELEARLRDIRTQRNQLEAVLSSMVEGVIAVDVEERVIRMNPAAARMLGCSPAGARNRSIQEVSRNTGLQRFVAETLESDALVERDLSIHVEKDRLVHAHGTGLWDDRGDRMGSLIVLDDITRLRRLENIRRDFAANVSHEIKTPITAIKGFVETLRETGTRDDPATTQRFLEIIARHAERLEVLLEDLLDLSRIEEEEQAGGIGLQPGHLSEILHEAAGMVREKTGVRKDPFRISCPPGLVVPMNPVLLEQAFVNLLENAVKYSPSGSEVRVSAARSGGEAVVRVEDSGSGIPAEHLDRIFERFYRVDRSRSRKLGGTGLGLAIVKHVIQIHGGSVEVESTPGRGSTFTVRLGIGGEGAPS
ncbi:MAG: HAMP domain-containing protein [Deltaproteobacteria bacterium]|nr:HAMP domain-containing protein [Deltaproteobacteria bacterium]